MVVVGKTVSCKLGLLQAPPCVTETTLVRCYHLLVIIWFSLRSRFMSHENSELCLEYRAELITLREGQASLPSEKLMTLSTSHHSSSTESPAEA